MDGTLRVNTVHHRDDVEIEDAEERNSLRGESHSEGLASDEATAGQGGGFAASGFTETASPGSAGDPTDEENLKDATTGAASAPNYGVLNADE